MYILKYNEYNIIITRNGFISFPRCYRRCAFSRTRSGVTREKQNAQLHIIIITRLVALSICRVRGTAAIWDAVNAKSRYKIIGSMCSMLVGTDNTVRLYRAFSIFDGTCESVFQPENHGLKEKVSKQNFKAMRIQYNKFMGTYKSLLERRMRPPIFTRARAI